MIWSLNITEHRRQAYQTDLTVCWVSPDGDRDGFQELSITHAEMSPDGNPQVGDNEEIRDALQGLADLYANGEDKFEIGGAV